MYICWCLYRVLRGNVQVVVLAASSSVETTIKVASSILSGFVLSIQQLTVQELRFRVLGGDVEASCKLIQQMTSTVVMHEAGGSQSNHSPNPNPAVSRQSSISEAMAGLELARVNANANQATAGDRVVHYGPEVVSLLMTLQDDIEVAAPYCCSQAEADVYYLDQHSHTSTTPSTDTSKNPLMPHTVTMYRWGKAAEDIFQLVHQLSDVLGLPPTPAAAAATATSKRDALPPNSSNNSLNTMDATGTSTTTTACTSALDTHRLSTMGIVVQVCSLTVLLICSPYLILSPPYIYRVPNCRCRMLTPECMGCRISLGSGYRDNQWCWRIFRVLWLQMKLCCGPSSFHSLRC